MVLLHERWFVDSTPFPVHWEQLLRPPSLWGLVAAVAVTVLARVLWQTTGRRLEIPGPIELRTDRARLATLLGLVPLILSVHFAIPLVVFGVELCLLAPNLRMAAEPPVPVRSLFAAAVALGEIGTGIALLYGVFTRVAALMVALLWVAGAVHFGPVLLLEHTEYLGVAAMLLLTGRGRWGIDALLHPRLATVNRAHLRWAVPALRLGTAVSLITLAFTEKLANVPLGLDFLHHFPLNFLPVDDRTFLVIAGAVELTFGLLLLTNTYVRLGTVLLWVPFNLTLAVFGWRELVGHLPLYGAMAVLLLWGAGDPEEAKALEEGLQPR